MNLDSKKKYAKKGVTIFASGNGSNAENCMHYFEHDEHIFINMVITNNKHAGVIQKAITHNIPCTICSNTDEETIKDLINTLHALNTQLIVLAGYLSLIPPMLIIAFKHKIINIHPALLPKYGGIGMYGKHVHKAVFKNKEIETGITIHEVDEIYDHGKIIVQKKVPLEPTDTEQDIEQKVRALEYTYLPKTIKTLLS